MPIKKELKSSSTLIIAATDFSNNLGMPIGEFFTKAQLSETSKLIITTNPAKRLAVSGLPPEYPSFLDLLEHLRWEVSQICPERLILTGSSGGGYTALLLGHLLVADYVVAFSPFTYLSSEEGRRRDDPTINRLYKMGHPVTNKVEPEMQQFLDLRNVLADWNEKTQYYIHVPCYSKWDIRRSMYLRDMPKVLIHSHPYTKHNMIPFLACNQKLSQCFYFPYSKNITIDDLWLHLNYLKRLFSVGLRYPFRKDERSLKYFVKRAVIEIRFLLKRLG